MKTRYSRLLLAFLLLVLVAPQVGAKEPLSDEDIRRIVAMQGDDKPLIGPLSIYPKANTWKYEVTFYDPDGQIINNEKSRPVEKYVDGKYIVSEFKGEEENPTVYSVVTCDSQSGLQRKYIMVNDKVVRTFVGLRVGNTQSVAWSLMPSSENPDINMVMVETHTKHSTSWRSLIFEKEKLIATESGSASAIRD